MNDRIFTVLFAAGGAYALSRVVKVLAVHFARSRYQHAQDELETCVGFIEREMWLKRAAFWRCVLERKKALRTQTREPLPSRPPIDRLRP